MRLWRRPSVPAPAQRSDLRIGVIAARSGIWASYGEAAWRGFELGLAYATGGTLAVAGRPLRLLIEDDGGKEQKTQELAMALVQEAGCELLQGCTLSQPALHLLRVAQSARRVTMIAVAATDVLTAEWFTPYGFRTASCTAQDAAAGWYVARHLGRRIAFLSPDSLWGQQSRAAWWRVLAQAGAEIVDDVLVPPHITDFRPYVREAVQRQPEVLIPFWAGSLVRYLLEQLRELDLFVTLRVVGNLVDQETLQRVGLAPAGMICAVKYHYTFADNPVNAWLVQQHWERYGTPPDLLTESGFTSAVALVEALKRTAGDTRPERLIPALEGLKFSGPKGEYILRPQDHQALQPMYVAELVPDASGTVCEPRLLVELSAEETAPPIRL